MNWLSLSGLSKMQALTDVVTDRILHPLGKFVGRTVKATGVNNLLQRGLQTAHNALTGNYAVARKVQKLEQQERPFQLLRQSTGSRVLDWLGYRETCGVIYNSSENTTNFNGEVKTSKSNDEVFWCRHFTRAFLNHKGRKSAVLNEFKSPEAIARSTVLPSDDELNLLNKKNFFREVNYFQIQDLPKVLSTLAAELNEQEIKNFEFNSGDHCMGITLTNKGEKGFVLHFYDPNHTVMLKRVVVNKADDLQKIKVTDLTGLIGGQYFPTGDTPANLLSLDTVAEQKDFNLRLFSQPNIAMEELLIENGHYRVPANKPGSHCPGSFYGITNKDYSAAEAKRIGSALAEQVDFQKMVTDFLSHLAASNCKTERKIELLTAKCPINGEFLLQKAMLSGYVTEVEAYMSAVSSILPPAKGNREQADLTESEAIKKLLTAADENGKPGQSEEDLPALVAALSAGKSKSIEAYVSAVLTMPLPDKDKKELISAKYQGTPALYLMAAYGGSNDFTISYIKSFQAATPDDISEADMTELLMAEHQGKSCWSQAAEKGNTELLTRARTTIQNSTLPASTKKTLLAEINASLLKMH